MPSPLASVMVGGPPATDSNQLSSLLHFPHVRNEAQFHLSQHTTPYCQQHSGHQALGPYPYYRVPTPRLITQLPLLVLVRMDQLQLANYRDCLPLDFHQMGSEPDLLFERPGRLVFPLVSGMPKSYDVPHPELLLVDSVD